MRKNALLLTLAVVALVFVGTVGADAAAQHTNPRFGVWKMKSDAPPPRSNIMTYEPWGDGGMKITVASTNGNGESSEWGRRRVPCRRGPAERRDRGGDRQ